MKCDHCENEATVHEVTVRGGVRIERHMCEACAAQSGIASQQSMTSESLKAAMEPVAKALGLPVPLQAKPSACPACRTTFAEFKQSGLLGCAECYLAFGSQLGPLIERAHEGGEQHIGKKPARLLETLGRRSAAGQSPETLAALALERAQRIAAVRRLLDDAVRGEQYEKAASLRDELKRLTDTPGES
jgi:protein arginine kinase activator